MICPKCKNKMIRVCDSRTKKCKWICQNCGHEKDA